MAGAYADAGSRVILTNTFGANRFRLEGSEVAEKVAEVNRVGVEISRRVSGRPVPGFRFDGADRKTVDGG